MSRHNGSYQIVIEEGWEHRCETMPKSYVYVMLSREPGSTWKLYLEHDDEALIRFCPYCGIELDVNIWLDMILDEDGFPLSERHEAVYLPGDNDEQT